MENKLSFPAKRPAVFLLSVIFVLSAVCFYMFPWHDDRESIGASFSAFFRALWFVVAITYLGRSEVSRIFIAILTVALMNIDKSRTYFLLLLLIIAARSNRKKIALGVGTFSAILLGALRSADSGGGWDLLLYGIIGEGYNATKAVGQIYEVSSAQIDIFSHLTRTYLQPFTLPFDLVMSKIFGEGYPLQDFYLADLVDRNLGEIFNPMGGWFISGDFIYYGYFGIVLMCLYVWLTWSLSRYFLDTEEFPYGAFFFFISIKATPFIYWKFVFYVLAVGFFYRMISSVGLGLRLRGKSDRSNASVNIDNAV